MIDYQPLITTLLDARADAWTQLLPQQLARAFEPAKHGTLSQWQALIEQLPEARCGDSVLDADAIRIGWPEDLGDEARKQLEAQLKILHPWRKGPYDLFGISIDTEWRSDWKWHRLKDHITPLANRLVLDVGCGNGYHCWRMLGSGARMVVGIDPLLLNVMQFQAIRKLHGEAPVYVLPIGMEEVPYGLKLFDTVFSMGVLYHRRSPVDHLLELKESLRPGGELVLETLVIDGGPGQVLVPEGRYACMRNVWFLPTCDTLTGWMKRCGFTNIRVVDVTVTSTEEQRTTEWMTFHSLKDFLDPDDPKLTLEGLPAPKRAIIIANPA
ncbi:MAG: tRNA 5-methoxyuridine(34)/uridine 5-oxyacetic acid(34) synthase CmoB [Methylobacter sp.]|uniref:tRNA 5-methoxyuridine(34)/uridine 5-oxyacetic acid(34) synthase CmoB n=1 Tax=Methylobacter sp. TaxID=2051955 RepID=UPI00258587ED|nr:tRNA 5-methoxyuridine(34)/uridine 5-oxyacetic acid(34) synthase CmoB [Methylobacter sp.]MCL7421513.1 tRNA 5-methoxyuridine(34)/uridine 5-oxyacetic acid(34) synthase CmoB [Methylobacter sp.]